jgi:hypothetical protein
MPSYVFGQASGLDQEERWLEIETFALRSEREAIEAALLAGDISRKTARSLRDNVALMELDIESQLE